MSSTLTATRHGLGPVVAVHVALGLAGAVVLSLDAPAKGWGVLLTVVAYVVALQVACRRAGRPDLAALAAFLVAVSVFQVLPDWVLADLVGTLRFPDTGSIRVDDVIPVAMAGMWVAPLFVAVALAGGHPGRAALLAAVVFLGSELAAPGLGLWEPTGDTHRIAGVAVYVLPAEAALGWATAYAFRETRDRGVAQRIAAALAVSTFYLGALVLAHFLIDVAGWRLTA
ncbi:DUF6989 domain-containing protein [Aeromicrobium stalagmiti]|uniref:DUF6989 domain-containing protein n=1 Tax=Aeromicrobium stalagmiti TaxID=2738988 RepID=UPI0015680C97|nr:hypothetical protein [Aeromicrobium stalagmiti]NRQ50812.1 hypothetical protein [Aeromicrobium stalagmiti]